MASMPASWRIGEAMSSETGGSWAAQAEKRVAGADVDASLKNRRRGFNPALKLDLVELLASGGDDEQRALCQGAR